MTMGAMASRLPALVVRWRCSWPSTAAAVEHG